jgi:hypothetical protein
MNRYTEAFMLSFEEKLAILESFPELQRRDVSLGRVNFHYEKSAYEKKTVAYHLHPNGNGFVYGGHLKGYSKDEKGFVNIRDYTSEEFRDIIDKSIRSLTGKSVKTLTKKEELREERWIGPDNQVLVVTHEDDMWYLYAGLNLETAFDTYEEVEAYMQEEGFSRQ